MGSQHAKAKKACPENGDRNFSIRLAKGKKLKSGDDATSVSSLDLVPTLEGSVTALYDYDPSLNACSSAIAVKKGDSLWLYGPNPTGEWLDVMCRRTGERGWVPSSCVFDSSTTNPVSLPASGTEHVSCRSLIGERWYHGAIHRSYAEYLLNSGITGSFLVRESESNFGKLTISLRSDGRIFHYRVCTDETNQFYINEASRFPTVLELVQHHEKLADGLACPLLYGVSKMDRSLGCSNQGLDSDYDAWEINRTDIIMKHKLGSGQYGVVYEAIFKPYDVTVAVKTLKEDITLRDEFLQEARLMKSLRHPNLVRLLGVCTQEPPYYIITEFMCNGNLLDYLRTQPRDLLSPPVLLQMAIHVCRAMTYLEEHNFIHRDLAARNCLVGEAMTVKVADFGLARYMECDVTYRAREGAKFPIKWTAPEGLVYNCFSIKSDVWAFGVLLWEIATYGATPYPGVELQDVYVLLEKGTRMEAPQGCPDPVYQLMLDCWSWDSEDRPTFREVCTRLEAMHNSFDINAAVEHELQRDRIRMPPPPPPPPFFAHQRSSSCERVDDNSLVASAEVFRRGHAESFTSRDASVGSHCPPYNYHQQHHLQQGFASPSRGRMVPGNRFSEVFPASCMPPHQEVGSAGEPQDVHTAGSLGRKKAAPAPPMRTTTLRPEEQSEMLPTGLQVFTGDLHGCSRVVDDHLPSPPDVVCGNLHPHPGVHQLPQSSPPCVPEGHSLMTSSATFTTSPLTGAIRRAVLPVPPQRSESTRSQKSVNDFASQVSSHQPSKASPLKTHLTHSPPNGLATNPDFQNELSSRLKRQLEGSKSAVASNRSPGVSTLPKLKQPADGALTAEMIQASKSKLKTTSTPVVSEPQSPPLAPSVPAWKELVVQRRLKNAEAPVGKRMSWTPTSNTSAGSFKAQQPPSVESFPEEEDEDLPPIMSQSVTYGNGNEGAPTTGPLSYENLLKQVTSLCADLNLAKVNLPNEHNSALVDRIEGLKHACLSYVDEADCSAHSKFRFRDECARLQTAADALRAVCSVGGKPSSSSDCGGRRKTFQAACNTVEAIHQTLLRLPPSASAVPEAADDSCMSAGAV